MSQQEGQAEAGRARPLSLEELHEYRHVAASLAGSWQERFAAEQALQRVWPLPGLVGTAPLLDAVSSELLAAAEPREQRPAAGLGGWSNREQEGLGSEVDDEEEGEGRWGPWLAFLEERSLAEEVAGGNKRRRRGRDRRPKRPKRLAEGAEGDAAAPQGQLAQRVQAVLQTAEGLGWEAEGKEDVRDIMAARLGWGGGLPRPARGGEAGEGEAGGGEEAAAEEHWDGLEEEMHAAFTEIGLSMSEAPPKGPSSPQRRRALRHIQRSALARATNRLERAVEASVEYEDARLALRRRQRQLAVLGGEGSHRGPAAAIAGEAGVAPAEAPRQQEEAAAAGWEGGEGEESGEELRGGLEAADEGGEELGFEEVVERLRGILADAEVLRGAEPGVAAQLLEPLLWLPGEPWTAASLARLERLLNKTGLLASVGEELRQAERAQHRPWAPCRQRRAQLRPGGAAAQLEILQRRLLPAILPHLGQQGVVGEGAGQQGGNPRQLELGTQASAVGAQQRWHLGGAGAGMEADVPPQQSQQQQQQPVGALPLEAGVKPQQEEQGEGHRERRLAAAAQAGMGVLWGSLDWLLRSGAALAAADELEGRGGLFKVLTKRKKVVAEVLARPALPPCPPPLSNLVAASLLEAPTSLVAEPLAAGAADAAAAAALPLPAAVRAGLAPTTAARLQQVAASGTLTLAFQQQAQAQQQQQAQQGVAWDAAGGPDELEAAYEGPAAAGGQLGASVGDSSLPAVAARWEPAGQGSGGGGEGPFGEASGAGSDAEAAAETRVPPQPPLWQQPASGHAPPPHPLLAQQSRLADPAPASGPLSPATLVALAPAAQQAQGRWGVLPKGDGVLVRRWGASKSGYPKSTRPELRGIRVPVRLVRQWPRRSTPDLRLQPPPPPAGPPGGPQPWQGRQQQRGGTADGGAAAEREEGDEDSELGPAAAAGNALGATAASVFQPWVPGRREGADAEAVLGAQPQQQPGEAAPAAATRQGAPPVKAGAAACTIAGCERLQEELAQLPLDVQLAFEGGARLGLRPELLATALARYHAIVGRPPDAPGDGEWRPKSKRGRPPGRGKGKREVS